MLTIMTLLRIVKKVIGGKKSSAVTIQF